MKVESITITKTEKGKRYEARITDEHNAIINIALPMYTTRGMNGKMNQSTQKVIATTTRRVDEIITVEITKTEGQALFAEAVDTYGEEIGKRIEHQSETVTIVRL